jgi:peptide methionine sulfoxide reductase msrA/msrB
MKIKSSIALVYIMAVLIIAACAQQPNESSSYASFPEVIKDPANYNELSEKEAKVMLNEGTEWAFSGIYHDHKEKGTYICRQCNQPLFRSGDKFKSGSGWPSFDDAIEGAVREVSDADGYRVEIECSNCGGHLGHVFRGEGFTDKNTRHCVNSVSLGFVAAEGKEKKKKVLKKGVVPLDEYIQGKGYENYEKAVFAGGCFWCTEASFDRIQGVVDVISGYSGGEESFPSYEEVSSGRTGHAEAIVIFYDPDQVTFETLLDVFFVAHDPTQLNRQGPDRGPQYRSAIFYTGQDQKEIAEMVINSLTEEGTFDDPIVTELSSYEEFWVAEGYHQDYYEINPGNRYIQAVSKPKVEKVKKKFKEILKEGYK